MDEDATSISISKEVLPSLEGFDFDETILGDAMGSLKQCRNARGVHVREFYDHFEIHMDKVDPRSDPIGHLISDSPETLVAFAAASLLRSKTKNMKMSPLGNPLGFLFVFLSLNHFLGRIKRRFLQ
jgi:hypothetical protein